MTTEELLGLINSVSVGVRFPEGATPDDEYIKVWQGGVRDCEHAYRQFLTSHWLRIHPDIQAQQEDTMDLSHFNTIVESTEIEVGRVRVRVDKGGSADAFATLFEGSLEECDTFHNTLADHLGARE